MCEYHQQRQEPQARAGRWSPPPTDRQHPNQSVPHTIRTQHSSIRSHLQAPQSTPDPDPPRFLHLVLGFRFGELLNGVPDSCSLSHSSTSAGSHGGALPHDTSSSQTCTSSVKRSHRPDGRCPSPCAPWPEISEVSARSCPGPAQSCITLIK